jgi:hypothetical protein
MRFEIAPASEWRLEQNIGTARRKRLLETPFDSIVNRISEQATLRDYGSERIKKFPGSKRVWIKLILPRKIIDLFHNGAGGYRAQYYLGVEQGETANRYLINSLFRRLKKLCRESSKRTCTWNFAEASLSDSDAKAWIHQGTWLRTRKLADRILKVDRWIDNDKTLKSPDTNISIWAQLAPDCETGLDIFGGCIDENFHSIGKKLKPRRSQQLHDQGYT